MGRGTIPETPCKPCDGTGTVRQDRKIQVTVPKGAGERIEGAADGPGGTRVGWGENPGIWSSPSRSNLTGSSGGTDWTWRSRCPSTSPRPLWGRRSGSGPSTGKRWFSGFHRALRPGTRFRVRGQGVEKGGRMGDLYVEVKLEVPGEAHAGEAQRLDGGLWPPTPSSKYWIAPRQLPAPGGSARRPGPGPPETGRRIAPGSRRTGVRQGEGSAASSTDPPTRARGGRGPMPELNVELRTRLRGGSPSQFRSSSSTSVGPESALAVPPPPPGFAA